MRKTALLMTVTATAVLVAASILPSPSYGQAEPPKAVTKVLLDNDKVRVYETIFPPGAQGTSGTPPYRIVRALTDGSIQRIYPDGKTDTTNWKAGDVREVGPDPQYVPKNPGTTEMRIFVVVPKGK